MRLLDSLRASFEQFMLRVRWKTLMLISNESRIRALRKHGVRIGENCLSVGP